MKKLIIAACGFMMALSTLARAADEENTHKKTVKHGHTMTLKPKTTTTEKTKIKTATGEANATVTDTKVQERDGHVTETKKVDAEGTEKK